jgi:hypothetical protein
MWQVWETGEVHMVLLGDLMERNYLEDMGVYGRIILKMIFKEWDGEVWLWIGTGGGPLRMR